MRRNYMVCFLLIQCFFYSLLAQNDADFQVALATSNPSQEINDAEAVVKVNGGKPPYQYKY